MDSYLTIDQSYQSEIKIKASKFISMAFPVDNFEEAEEKLAEIRKEHWGANHHCYAIIIDTRWFRYSDDGEPNGTAGKPIFDVVSGLNLEKIMLVSVRYFGGTKLGTGGLVKAYSESVQDVLEQAEIVEKIIRTEARLRHSYDQTSLVLHHLSKFDVLTINSEYADDVLLSLAVRQIEFDALKATIFNESNGTIEITEIDVNN